MKDKKDSGHGALDTEWNKKEATEEHAKKEQETDKQKEAVKEAEKENKAADEKLEKAKSDAAATNKKLVADSSARQLDDKKKEIEKIENDYMKSKKRRDKT